MTRPFADPGMREEIEFLRQMLIEILRRLSAEPKLRINYGDLLRRIESGEGRP